MAGRWDGHALVVLGVGLTTTLLIFLPSYVHDGIVVGALIAIPVGRLVLVSGRPAAVRMSRAVLRRGALLGACVHLLCVVLPPSATRGVWGAVFGAGWDVTSDPLSTALLAALLFGATAMPAALLSLLGAIALIQAARRWKMDLRLLALPTGLALGVPLVWPYLAGRFPMGAHFSYRVLVFWSLAAGSAWGIMAPRALFGENGVNHSPSAEREPATDGAPPHS